MGPPIRGKDGRTEHWVLHSEKSEWTRIEGRHKTPDALRRRRLDRPVLIEGGLDSYTNCNTGSRRRGGLGYSTLLQTTKDEEGPMTYHQITLEERYRISAFRQAGDCSSEIARRLGRHRSTISLELSRNRSRWDGSYRPSKAEERANGRRSRSRRNQRFSDGDWRRVERLLQRRWSPEQISGALQNSGELSISHETIYRYLWLDRWRGGSLYRLLR
jgi:transposase